MNIAPSGNDLLSRFTVFCLVMNRTIASGIFTQPYNVVVNAGSPAAALLLWAAAGIISLCITLVWVEFGLSIPRHVISGELRSTPQSGGDKNYVRSSFPSR